MSETTFNNDDFVLYKNKEGGVESIGMQFSNLFRENNIPAMIGGGIGSHNKFGNIGIPVGLYMLNSQLKKNGTFRHFFGAVFCDFIDILLTCFFEARCLV